MRCFAKGPGLSLLFKTYHDFSLPAEYPARLKLCRILEIWEYGKMAGGQNDKDKNRNCGEATETQCNRLLIVACALLLIVQGRHSESI